jgi:hypothetical protein
MGKPSVYAGIVDKLPDLPAQDAKFFEKVLAERSRLIADPDFDKTALNLAHAFAAAVREEDEHERAIKALHVRQEALTLMLNDAKDSGDPAFGAYGATDNTVRMPDGSNVRVQKEPYASVFDYDANRKWAIEQGLERKLMLPWGTINSITKDRLKAGENEPPGVKAFTKTKVVYTKPRKKGESADDLPETAVAEVTLTPAVSNDDDDRPPF